MGGIPDGSSGPHPRLFEARFEGLNAAAANLAAQSLKQVILDLGQPGLQVGIRKAEGSTQDLGSIVEIAINSAAALAVARGIGAWLRSRAEATGLVIMDVANGQVVAKGVTTKPLDLVGLARALGHKDHGRPG